MSLEKIPVTIVSGYLGAGKTTLVNRLIADNPHTAIGIVVNEFGDIGIDGDLIEADLEAVIEITNGCICCTVRTDLVDSVLKLIDAAPRPLERIVVETSGLADPAPVVQSFLADPSLRERVRLESVVTVVDAAHAALQRGDAVADEQIAFADLLLLSKTDLIEDAAITELQHAIRSINPSSLVSTLAMGTPNVPVFGADRFNLVNLLELEPNLLNNEADHDHEHDQTIEAFGVESTDALDPARVGKWLSSIVQMYGNDLLRMKGVLHLKGERRRFHVHSVHMLLESTPGARWGDNEARTSKLVFIGRHLDKAALLEHWRTCAATPDETRARLGV
ncbi:CobW family GTP-binding protein (plasmid) [Ralstonia sp. 25C]|uniref:CobW family GTP-binding protein n=1 Tax=Ralstonia sp. 25C TaxID=3447363 RepID=UPI003F75417D